MPGLLPPLTTAAAWRNSGAACARQTRWGCAVSNGPGACPSRATARLLLTATWPCPCAEGSTHLLHDRRPGAVAAAGSSWRPLPMGWLWTSASSSTPRAYRK
eukprot:9301805-Alexandrium_andersonii.AAC.1